jgi:5-oxoprolinase (ATP-hydrolysing) subunit A
MPRRAAGGQPQPQSVDLNCDLGESFGAWTLGHDAEVMASITSANIACGYHAGDPGVMRRTVRLARDAGVAIGAHPGLPDLAGFGRRDMHVSADEVTGMVLYQVGALAAIARAEGVTLQHVKPHGALYNVAARDRVLAEAIADAVRVFDPSLVLFGLAGSALVAAGEALGLRVAAEVFADRAYRADGSLVPRGTPGAVIADPAQVAARAVEMVRYGRVTATTGERVTLRADTICVHGDTPDAPALAGSLRAALAGAGIAVKAFR